MRPYVIRHGQTDWNVEGKIQGRQDIPLNAAGHSQAEMLAKGTEKRPVIAIYSSPQTQAVETAETLARARGVTVILMPELAEIRYGDWEGRTASDILAEERKLYEEWRQHPATVALPGGETLNQVGVRCKKAWERIKGEMRGDTAVVVHGGAPAHFIVHLLEGQSGVAEVLVGNVGITTIEYGLVTGQCSFVGLSDRSHLM